MSISINSFQPRNAYIDSKIQHMARLGLVSAKSTGLGIYGGAAPDWLNTERKAHQSARAKFDQRRDIALDDGL